MIAMLAILAVIRGYAPVSGLQMYYEIHGSGGTPLVLLHGGGSTIETSFAKLLPLLSRNRQVIAFEQQGHGHTADVDRPFSFEQSAEDAVALLRYLKIPKADFFGYSNGGHIALQVALSHPEVVRRLILESAMYSREGADPRFWEGFEHAKLEDEMTQWDPVSGMKSPSRMDALVWVLTDLLHHKGATPYKSHGGAGGRRI